MHVFSLELNGKVIGKSGALPVRDAAQWRIHLEHRLVNEGWCANSHSHEDDLPFDADRVWQRGKHVLVVKLQPAEVPYITAPYQAYALISQSLR